MNTRVTCAGRLWHRLRNPPIGYQHGRRSRFTRNFPMVSWVYYGLIAHTTPRLFVLGAVGVAPTLLMLLVGFDSRILPLGFAVLAWMGASMVAGLLGCPRLEVTPHMPVRVECGSRFVTQYTVYNRSGRVARDLAIDTLIFSDWLSLRRKRARLTFSAPLCDGDGSGVGQCVITGVSIRCPRYGTTPLFPAVSGAGAAPEHRNGSSPFIRVIPVSLPSIYRWETGTAKIFPRHPN